jgi:hypothetical protein
VNNANTLRPSTFGDFTKVEGFLATGALTNVNGFGNDIRAFTGRQETGGQNYAFRLNSTIRPNFIGEFSGGLHFQRANTIPTEIQTSLVLDNFAVLRNGAVLTPVSTGVTCPASGCLGTGFIDFVDGRGGSLQRNYSRGPGFGLFTTQDRNRYEINAHMQNIAGKHTVKWGFEWFRNMYDINTLSSGPAVTYAFTPGLGLTPTNGASNVTNGSRITNNWLVCTTRANAITCPTAASVVRAQAIPAATLAALGLTVNPAVTAITTAEAFNNPFIHPQHHPASRDFRLVGKTYTNAEAFYVQDDYKFARDFQFSIGAPLGLRAGLQQ